MFIVPNGKLAGCCEPNTDLCEDELANTRFILSLMDSSTVSLTQTSMNPLKDALMDFQIQIKV